MIENHIYMDVFTYLNSYTIPLADYQGISLLALFIDYPHSELMNIIYYVCPLNYVVTRLFGIKFGLHNIRIS